MITSPRRLNYAGDLTKDVVLGTVLGPNELGEHFYVHQAEFNPATGQTTLGLDLRPLSQKQVQP